MRLSRAEREIYRKARSRSFNEAWELLEKKRRTRADDRRMLDLAHTARQLARLEGTPRNHAIGDWQVSRVYAALGEPRLARAFAESSLELARRHHLTDLVGTAYEAIARACVVGSDRRSARAFLARSRHLLQTTALDPDDRQIYLDQIRDTENLLRRGSGAD